MKNTEPKVQISIQREGTPVREFAVRMGENLREALLAHDESPYRGYFRQVNCKGMGICGSCKVGVREGGEIWIRRSCQIRCFQDIQIELQ